MNRLISSSVGERLSALIALAAVLLVGCEAPLVLDGVEQEKRNAVRRSDNFQSLAYNGSTLVVVGGSGAALVSTDGGQNWVRNRLPDSPFLMTADTCPDNTFVAIDYRHNLWTAGADGTGWQAKQIDTIETPQALTCDDQGRLWIVGGFSSILRSDDQGESWMETSLDEDLHFTTVQFVDENNGLLTGEFGVVARTSDGGESWEMLEPIPDEFYPQDAWFETANRGWVVGLNGTVFYTEDGGANWQSQETGTNDPIHSISANGNSLYAVGGNGLVLVCDACISGGTPSAWQVLEHGLPIRFYLRAVGKINGELLVGGGAGALHSIALAGQNKSSGGAE